MVRSIKYLLAAALMVAAATAQARVDYAIDLTSPEHHLGQVSIDFPATSGTYLDVKMPAWRTGRYTILDLANGVRRFSATDGQGHPLSWHKIDKSTWRIDLAQPSAVHVGYELYANELGLRTRHIDDSHAYLDASATFMYADKYRADDVSVTLNVPRGWNSFSGLNSTGPQRFAAANWDILVDSPIETGLDRSYRFTEGGRDYEVVFWGEGNFDPQGVVADIRKIVPQAASIWSGYPFQRYVFMIHATDGAGGATEHRNSTVIQIPRWSFQPRDKYLGFLSTTAHEFIHTWNVKYYRNAGMVPYNYQSENYTDLLWLEEGSTEYFADPFLLRAGLMKPDEYFEGLVQADRSPPAQARRERAIGCRRLVRRVDLGGRRPREQRPGRHLRRRADRLVDARFGAASADQWAGVVSRRARGALPALSCRPARVHRRRRARHPQGADRDVVGRVVGAEHRFASRSGFRFFAGTGRVEARGRAAGRLGWLGRRYGAKRDAPEIRGARQPRVGRGVRA